MAATDVETKERILHAAIASIDQGGDASLRVVEVAKNAGVSQGMIRYYFGDREQLVAEAKALRFRTRYGFMLNEFREATSRCTTSDEFRELIIQIMGVVFTSERSTLRLERNSDIGSAKDYEGLATQIAQQRDELCSDLAAVFEDARSRGLIRNDTDCIGVAASYLAFTHGISLWEFGPEFVTRERLVKMFQVGLFATIFE
ncbi:MAG: hypothetical protein RIR69_1142 [Actinomycetota bacterium]